MRQVITLKFLVLALVIAVLGALLIWIYSNGDSGTIETENLRRAPDPGQNIGRDAGQRRFAVFQFGQSDAGAGSLDAHDHHTQSIVGGDGL